MMVDAAAALREAQLWARLAYEQGRLDQAREDAEEFLRALADLGMMPATKWVDVARARARRAA